LGTPNEGAEDEEGDLRRPIKGKNEDILNIHKQSERRDLTKTNEKKIVSATGSWRKDFHHFVENGSENREERKGMNKIFKGTRGWEGGVS